MREQRRGRRTGLAVALAVTGVVALPTAAGAASHEVRGDSRTDSRADSGTDFNGDGYADLAVAAPEATVGGRSKAGYVAVVYGSASGPKTSTKQVFSQDSAGIPGAAETGDQFGSALTTADLDRDGYTDLVVGAGGENGGAGLVEVVWGGARGLAGGAFLANGAAYDRLGTKGHLAAADVDGDGATDLVTVVNQHDLSVTGGPFTRDGSAGGVKRVVKDKYDSRVLDLAVGDLNGDGITDVAATENDADEFDARRVVYWWGTKDGLTPYTLVYDVDGAGLQGGENLAIGDVNRDGYADIVVGRAVDGYDSDLDTYRAKGGRITWIPGTAEAPDGVKATFFNQDSPGVPGTAEKGDGFGTDVQVADVDGDGYPDVVTGLPGEDLGAVADAGSVVVLRGGSGGPTGTGAGAVHQDIAGVPGVAEKGDLFGGAVHLAGSALAVGAPGENTNAGSVWVFRTTAAGVTPTGSLTFGAGTLGTVAANARLGSGFTN